MNARVTVTDELIEKALREFVKPRMTTNMSLDGPRAKLEAALSAVAPLIAAQALREAAETYTVTIPDALGYKVQAVFIEDLMAHADRIEQGGQP